MAETKIIAEDSIRQESWTSQEIWEELGERRCEEMGWNGVKYRTQREGII